MTGISVGHNDSIYRMSKRMVQIFAIWPSAEVFVGSNICVSMQGNYTHQ